MKKEVNPLAIGGIVAVLVVALVFFGYRALQPAPYLPSPGSGTASGGSTSGEGNKPGQPSAGKSGSANATYYPTAPPGSTPGRPPGK
ncbi:MAG: hypothetical protein H7308_15485 [Chthonomonadaceae bacterium]|nr:hypothetical protein [Chthonomonadaceae bacterium]